jgi:hypothetical protein
MKREFIMTLSFDQEWKNLGLCDQELKELQELILSDPNMGKVIQGTGGLRKLRFPYKGKGKRSGVRVLYVDFKILEKIYLIDVYSKGTVEDISVDEKRIIKKQILELKTEAMRRR